MEQLEWNILLPPLICPLPVSGALNSNPNFACRHQVLSRLFFINGALAHHVSSLLRCDCYGLPPSSNVFHAEEIPGLQKPCNILEGFDHTEKRFRTAEAKEYPAGLCKAMIITLFNGLRTRIRQEGSRIHSFNDLRPEDGQWMLRVAEASGTVFASDFLPDYQPNRGT